MTNICYICGRDIVSPVDPVCECAVRDARATQSDWEQAHELLDKAGVLTTPKGEVGTHLIDRIKAVLAVWEPIGRLSGQVCHDLRFLCNNSEETIEAIEAHRKAFREKQC